MTERDTVITVIRYLGRIALLLAGGLLALTWRVLDQAGKVGQVDPVAVGAVAAVGSALTFVLGALGALLVSTKSAPDLSPVIPPTPVVVANEEPIEVEPVGG